MTIVEVGGVGLVVDVISSEEHHGQPLRAAPEHGHRRGRRVLALTTLLFNDRDDLAQDSIVLLARKAEQTSGAVAVLSQPGLTAHLAEALAASSS
uniref:Uncharacterized protein n=1 Tax=Oryza nivara TaxID=4536 RepID=A0A0E0GZ23_ORYNI